MSWDPAAIALVLAALPALNGLVNLFLLRAPEGPVRAGTLVSILIPARDEAANIGACLEAALAQWGVDFEVVVMNDGSTDATPAIVRDITARDARVRLLSAPPLPEGWSGKMHACAQLGAAARGTHLLFIDADVRLAERAERRLRLALHRAHDHRVARALFDVDVAGERELAGSRREARDVVLVTGDATLVVRFGGAGDCAGCEEHQREEASHREFHRSSY